MCLLDMMMVLYTIGVATLGFTGWRIYESYTDAKQKANGKPGSNQNQEPVSSE